MSAAQSLHPSLCFPIDRPRPPSATTKCKCQACLINRQFIYGYQLGMFSPFYFIVVSRYSAVYSDTVNWLRTREKIMKLVLRRFGQGQSGIVLIQFNIDIHAMRRYEQILNYIKLLKAWNSITFFLIVVNIQLKQYCILLHILQPKVYRLIKQAVSSMHMSVFASSEHKQQNNLMHATRACQKLSFSNG